MNSSPGGTTCGLGCGHEFQPDVSVGGVTSIRSLAFFIGGPLRGVGVLVGTATVTTQCLTALATRRTNSGDFYLAKTGDSDFATSGDFFMATDTHTPQACSVRHRGRRAPCRVIDLAPGRLDLREGGVERPGDIARLRATVAPVTHGRPTGDPVPHDPAADLAHVCLGGRCGRLVGRCAGGPHQGGSRYRPAQPGGVRDPVPTRRRGGDGHLLCAAATPRCVGEAC